MYLGEIEEFERYGFSLEGETAKYLGTYETVVCVKKGFRYCEFRFEQRGDGDEIEPMPRADVEKYIFKIK